MIMLFCTNVMFLAYSMSKDGLEGTVFGMEHWRVGGHIHRKFSATLIMEKWSKVSKFIRNGHSALVNSSP